MSASIVPQLVIKDLRLMSPTILMFGLVSIIFIGIISLTWDHLPTAVKGNFGFIMLVGPAGTLGITLLIMTTVQEKQKSTQHFIMSLPITVKEFTRAKLWVNLPVFCLFWAAISAAGFYFAFGRGLLPLGALPFVSMVFWGGFVAYCCILAVSLTTQSLGITVLSIALFEVATSVYLWMIVYLPQISAHIWSAEVVWNPTTIGILAAQALTAVSVLALAMWVQNKKRDFI
jgi:hypothetical protein